MVGGGVISERVATFGADRALVGVLTLPQSSTPNAPALVLLNAGVVHRVGPNRLHVTLARRLAECGYPVLRFDLAGLGDSGARHTAGTLVDAAVRDTREALDYVERALGTRRFVVFGICTGAQHAFEAASADSRVVGALMVDGYAYRTVGYWARHYGRRMLRAESWLNVVKGRNDVGRAVRRWFGARPPAREQPKPELFAFPSRSQIAKRLRQLADRGVALRFIYTASWEPYYNHASQFNAMFGWRGADSRVCADYLDECDHTFTLLGQQAELVRLVRDWLQTIQGRAAAASHASKASTKYFAAQLGNAI